MSVYKLERVFKPINITAAQPLDRTLGLFAKQDDAGLSICSASIIERLPNRFGPLVGPIDFDCKFVVEAIDAPTGDQLFFDLHARAVLALPIRFTFGLCGGGVTADIPVIVPCEPSYALLRALS